VRQAMRTDSDRDAAYSTAVRCGDFLFLSGLVAENPQTGQPILGDILEQTRAVFDQAASLLALYDSSLRSVLRAEVYLTDLSDCDGMNQVFREVFPTHPPTRHTVEVSALHAGVKIEVVLFAATDAAAQK
jgi:2-iminobutanoate/2-iminopropanoate deaminase